MSDRHDVDLIIVGAGPTGLFAAYYAGFRGFSVALVDSLDEAGGQITAMYPEKLIYDVAGFPAIKGQDLVDNLVKQAAPFNPRYVLGERADTCERTGDREFTVTTNRGTLITTKAVLVTGGLGNFTPRALPQADEFHGRGLRYFVPRLDELAGLDVLIVGGGDSAVDWALSLEPISKSVTLIHRRDKFRAHEHSVNLMRASSCQVLTPFELTRIEGDDAGIKAVEIEHNQTHERMLLEVQAVVAALGFVADLGPLQQWGLTIEKRQILVDSTMSTNVPGIFAAGDIVEYPGKVRLIATGFGEAATAVNNAAPAIDPSMKVFPGHSSDVG